MRILGIKILMWLACIMASQVVLAWETFLPSMNGAPGDFAPRRAGSEVGAMVKISVTNEGIYRVTQAALTNIGVNSTALVGSQIRMYCRSQEVAIIVSSAGLWSTSDSLLFYGRGFDGEYSPTNVYWLGVRGSGKRMTTRSAAPFDGVSTVRSAPWTARYHKDVRFRNLYRPNDASFDHWFAAGLSETASTNLVLTTDQIVSVQPATVSASLYGYSSLGSVNPDHCTRIVVNGVTSKSFYYDGQSTYVATWSFPGSVLVTNNTLNFQQILQSGVANDFAFLQEFTIAYTRNLLAMNSALIFSGKTGVNNYQVDNFATNTGFCALDVTVPSDPVQMTGFVPTNLVGGYGIRFGDNSSVAGRYAVCQSAGVRTPVALECIPFRNLSETNQQADYIVICPYSFRKEINRLLKYRYIQGIKAVVAPLSDVYNEFGYGLADASAIKQFLGYAFHHWQSPPPRYVLLVGNGSYDPYRNLVGTSVNDSYAAPNIIPVHMGPGAYKWTALDGWYVQVNGSDMLPDMALGRMPVVTEAQLKGLVDKIVALEAIPKNDSRRTRALLVADKRDVAGGLDFKTSCNSVMTSYLRPSGLSSATAYNDVLSAAVVRQTIAKSINAGVFITYYFGHGNMDQWGDNNIYNTNDVYALANGFYPLVSMLTCENGSFESPTDHKSMVEAFLERASRGAALCIGATALTDQQTCDRFAAGFSRKLVSERTRRAGDAFLAGCLDLYSYDSQTQELLFIELFGDPATVVNPP